MILKNKNIIYLVIMKKINKFLIIFGVIVFISVLFFIVVKCDNIDLLLINNKEDDKNNKDENKNNLEVNNSINIDIGNNYGG